MIATKTQIPDAAITHGKLRKVDINRFGEMVNYGRDRYGRLSRQLTRDVYLTRGCQITKQYGANAHIDPENLQRLRHFARISLLSVVKTGVFEIGELEQALKEEPPTGVQDNGLREFERFSQVFKYIEDEDSGKYRYFAAFPVYARNNGKVRECLKSHQEISERDYKIYRILHQNGNLLMNPTDS